MAVKMPRIVWTPELDAAIAKVFRAQKIGGLDDLARETGIARSTLSTRGRVKLGMPPMRRVRPGKKVRWAPADDEFIVRWGHEPSMCIARRMRAAGHPWRSAKNIANRRCELRQQGQPVGAWREDLTAEEVAEGLGVKIDAVLRWIRLDLLTAKALRPDSPSCKFYRIQPADLRRFLYHHPTYLASASPDLVWYNDIVFGPCPADVQAPSKGRQRRRIELDGTEYPLHLESAHA